MQKIKAGSLELEFAVLTGGWHFPPEAPDTKLPLLKVILPEGQLFTQEQIEALKTHAWDILDHDGSVMGTHAGYSRMLPVEVSFIKVDDAAAQIEQLQQQAAALNASMTTLQTEKAEIAQQATQAQGMVTALGQTLRAVADDLPDESAVKYLNLYPELLGDGKEVMAGQRRRMGDDLYKANVTVWDRPDQWPNAQPGLWTKITQTAGVEAWVQPTGAHDAYHFGAVKAHKGKVWRSTVEDGPKGEAKNVWEPGVYGWAEVPA